MSTDYRPMWTELGLDLEAHDALLGVLGSLYEQTFMRQHNRPAGMKYFAGTGQFLEMMATALAYTREEFAAAAGRAARGQRLSSMCTVFAQSEVVSLIARGASKEEMALGVHQSIANRTAALAGGVQVEEPVVFTGGCAHSPCLVSLLSAALKRPLQVPDWPQTVAALGCALCKA
jgi:predicted CoA-substrate-specific enzyme activase